MSDSVPSNAQPRDSLLERRRHDRASGSIEAPYANVQSSEVDRKKPVSTAKHSTEQLNTRQTEDDFDPSTIEVRYICINCRVEVLNLPLWIHHTKTRCAVPHCPIEYCDKHTHEFHDKLELDRHMMDKHKPNRQHWCCSLCDFQTKDLVVYNDHLQHHPLQTGHDQRLWWNEWGGLFEIEDSLASGSIWKVPLWIDDTTISRFARKSARLRYLLGDIDNKQDQVDRNDDTLRHQISDETSPNLKRKTNYTISEDLSGDAHLQKRLCILKERPNPFEMARALRHKRLV